MDAPLSRLVEATGAIAAGCWRMENETLNLIGFGSVKEMLPEVRQGFQDATRKVCLNQTNLGIVQASVSKKPTIAHRDPGQTGLDGSASWIVKFAASTSLAVPIFDSCSRTVIGALAISTAAQIRENDELWNKIVYLSELLCTPD